jgi:hypothetical protein
LLLSEADQCARATGTVGRAGDVAELEAAGGVGEEEVEGSGGFGRACDDGGYGCALGGSDAGGYGELD